MKYLGKARLYKRVRARILSWDRELGRRAYRSNAGFFRYLCGERRVKAARAKCGYDMDTSWALGYARLGTPFDDDLIACIVERFRNLIEDERYYIRRGTVRRLTMQSGREYNRILVDPARNIPEVTELLNEAVCDRLRKYYGAEFAPLEVQGWRNYHIPQDLADRDLLSNYWHNDSLQSDTVKVYVALQDITEEDGPFHFVPRQETRVALGRRKFDRSPYNVPPFVRLEHINRLTGPIGSALLVNTTHCLHRAGIPGPGRTRDLLELRFSVSDAARARIWPTQEKWLYYNQVGM